MKSTFLKCLQNIDKNPIYKQIDILDITPKYLVVNKPSGIQCNGTKNYSDYLLPQLYKQLKTLYSAKNPNFKLNPNQYKIIHRIDKYVSGGLIIARGKNAKAFTKSFSKQESNISVKRRYIGLIPIPNTSSFKEYLQGLPNIMVRSDNNVKYLNRSESAGKEKGLIFNDDLLTEGVINFDILAVPKDDRKQQNVGTLVNYDAVTKFKIMHYNFHIPTTEQITRFPKLFNNKTLYPIVLELGTGRKNQIRDHILQAFQIPLFNDDKFNDFKMVLRSKDININSEAYITNQIGLHSAFLNIQKNSVMSEYVIPIPEADKYLWNGFLEKNSFTKAIECELRSF